MIYLIESAGYKEEGGNTTFFKLLKIGYTEDSRKDRRIDQYKLHNPTSKVLFEIPNGTEDHEKRIQYKFRDLKYNGYGNEWFNYSEEIINFFKEIKSLEDIEKNLPKGSSDKHKYLKYKNIAKEVVKYTYPVSDLKDVDNNKKAIDNYYNKLIVDLGDKISDLNIIYDYIKNDFSEDVINKYLKIKQSKETKIYSKDDGVNQEVNNFLEVFYNLPTMYEKLKMLCEGGLSQKAIEIVLGQMSDSDEIKSYYTTLGPIRLRALSYNKTFIKKELGIVMFNPLLLQNHIYQDFKVGDKLSLADIKIKLKNIYDEISYKAAPKANDIENYFEIKEISLYEKKPDGSRKRIKAYELLSQKHVLVETGSE